jgi:hypothetical protein
LSTYNSSVDSLDVVRDSLNRLIERDLRQVALLAFVVGVALHACVISAVLSGDGISTISEPSGNQVAATVTPGNQTAATPTPLRDRTTCAEVRGTDYRSDAERAWFIANCS